MTIDYAPAACDINGFTHSRVHAGEACAGYCNINNAPLIMVSHLKVRLQAMVGSRGRLEDRLLVSQWGEINIIGRKHSWPPRGVIVPSIRSINSGCSGGQR